MAPPVVSVVMPTYNAAEYIHSAIASILDQTFQNFELVIVDGNSTDGTIAVVESFDDDRIRTIQLSNRIGIPFARNRGIEEADGDYIACHDADDRSHPERLARQLEYLEAHPSVAAVGTGARLVDENANRIARRHILADPSLADLLEEFHFIHPTMTFRRTAISEVGGYDEWFEVAEDYELVLRLADKFPVRNIDEQLYERRIHEDSVYASELGKMWLYALLAVKKASDPTEYTNLKEIADRDGIRAVYEHLSHEDRRTYHRKLARDLLRYGQPRESRLHARRAISLSNQGPMEYLLYSLSFAPTNVTKRIATEYRKWLLNPRIRIANAHRRPAPLARSV